MIRERSTALGVLAAVAAPGGPAGPELAGALQQARRRAASVTSGAPACEGIQHSTNGTGLARPHREGGLVPHAAPDQPHRGAQPDRVRAGDRRQAVIDPPHPRQHPAVAEPDRSTQSISTAPATPVDDPDQHRLLAVAGRHEVGHRHGAAHRVPGRLEDERAVLVAAADLAAARFRALGHGRADLPLAVGLIAQQRGEAGVGVEPGQAQPVHAPVAADECRGLHVADERVVLDEPGHANASRMSECEAKHIGDPRQPSHLVPLRPVVGFSACHYLVAPRPSPCWLESLCWPPGPRRWPWRWRAAPSSTPRSASSGSRSTLKPSTTRGPAAAHPGGLLAYPERHGRSRSPSSTRCST